MLNLGLVMILFNFYSEGLNRLAQIVNNPTANSYFADALKITDLHLFLKNYLTNIPTLLLHSQVHPPGPIVLFYLTNITGLKLHLNPPLFSAFVVAFLASCTAIPVYFLAKEFYSEAVARIAVLLCPLIPAMLFFIPLLDVIYGFFFISIILFYTLGDKNKKSIYFILSGFIWALSLFFSWLFLLVPLVLLILLFLLYFSKNEKQKKLFSFQNLLKTNGYFLLTAILFWLIYWLIFGYNIYDLYRATMIYHHDFLATRSYKIWLFLNLFDFFVFLGIPLALVYLFGLGKEITNLIQKKLINVPFWLFTLTIIILDLTGKNRSETARIWLFLMPLALIPIANYIFQTKNKNVIVFLVIFLLLLQLLIFQKFIMVVWF